MGLTRRMKRVISANLNDLVARAKDPERALSKLIADMERDLEEARPELSEAEREQRSLYDQFADHELRAQTMERKAVLAAQQGDDDLAREALRRRHDHRRAAGALRDQWKMQKRSVELLRIHMHGLELKIEEARRKRDLLLARDRLTKARRGIQETTWERTRREQLPDIGDMEDDVEQIEAEAEAAATVAADFLATKVKQMESDGLDREAEIEAELQEIKARVRGRRNLQEQG
jgi:phage shock protein A